MSFRTSTPFDMALEPALYQNDCYNDEFFDQFLNLQDSCQIDEGSALAVVPRSPHMATAPSPSHSQASGFDQHSYPSHRLSQADSDVVDIGYWSNSNHSRPQSPVGRGRSKTFSEHQLLRNKRRSERFDFGGVICQSPPCYTVDSSPPSPTQFKPVTSSPRNLVASLRRKKSFNNRSVSSFRSAREPSREREARRGARSASRSAIRKTSNPPKMSKASASNAYAQVTLEEWNAKLAQQASQFDFGFQTSSAPPISPPPSARVSDASSSESAKGMLRARATAQQKKHHQQQQQEQQPEQWAQPHQQYAVTNNPHMLTPLTTPKYNEVAIQHNSQQAYASESQQWSTAELQQDMNGSFLDMSFVVDGDRWWEETTSEQETSPVVLSHNESFPQPMAISPMSARNINTKSLQIALPPADKGPDWPTIDTDADVDLTISPGIRPTPVALTNANHFAGHAHTQSLPNTVNSMLLQPHVSLPPSPTRVAAIPGSAEPSPLRHQKSGSYFSNVAPPPVPAYLQGQQASPLLPQHSSPLRHGKSRRHLEYSDHPSPPSRSVSPSLYSQSFPNALGIMGMDNHSTPNFSTPHAHPYPLQVRKRLSTKASEPSFANHHQRGRSSQLSASGYPPLPNSASQSFSQPSGSPSPRMHSRARMHARSKSSSNLRSSSSSGSAKRSSSAKKGKDTGISMEIEFHNFTPRDGNRILNGVAPSGSSKTKARREKEAAEKRRRLSEVALRAIREAGGDCDLKELGCLMGEELAVESGGEMDVLKGESFDF